MTYQFGWEAMPLLNFILSLVLVTAIFGVALFVYCKVIKRVAAFVSLIVSYVLIMASIVFNLLFVGIVAGMLAAVTVSVCLFANLGDMRAFLASPFKRTSAKAANFGVEKIFDRSALYKNIETTVLSLSKSRTGALITFEKNTSLKDIIKNGVPVHAPVSPELLQTIFYTGTRLHDGAVVIHGNEIVAASVFFTPTTKPFAGKYGSRHRAAIGISEVSDSVTVVVSEETGRISLAVSGSLEAVDPQSFLRAFETYMSDSVSAED
ncbi:MAG: DNA integrity scanning protein DisA nucleotide-binding domain protein [Bacilli bacterium]|nr:DNA integrity scanning protein DisA nucleotide-binding domain protein [Bacilli bacterium]